MKSVVKIGLPALILFAATPATAGTIAGCIAANEYRDGIISFDDYAVAHANAANVESSALRAAAEGDVARFVANETEYQAAPEVTKTRLYLEAMSEILPKVKLTVVDKEAGIVNLKSLGQVGPKP